VPARRIALLLALAAAFLLGRAAAAQQIVTSAGPDKVSVTVYRDPTRPAGQALNLGWLNGYALISETRHVRLPAGESSIRFEGVAGGILPQSAIVSGLPDGVVEKNLDAELLSPAALLDRSLGRRVHLSRTAPKSGTTVEQEAIVRSSAAGAVVLQTADGFEALRCTGLKEAIAYDGVPAGLSAKPTLSVRARASAPVEAEITLSYLSTDFDWQADYVATLAPSDDRLDLFAWVTLASSDETSFVRADTQTIAGHPNRTDPARQYRTTGQPLYLRCWPAGTTSNVPTIVLARDSEAITVTGTRIAAVYAPAPPPPPPPPPPLLAMEAKQENVGDLKLYRIPEPVTVAANSQKQVALLHRQAVKVRLVYRSEIFGGPSGVLPVDRVLRMQNRAEQGLGLPLPDGRLVLFAGGPDRRLLIGAGAIADKAVGEKVEIPIGNAPGVSARVADTGRIRPGRQTYALTVSNDRDRPVQYEAGFASPNAGKGLVLVEGRWIWSATVPAHGRLVYRFTL
jgi:hypothetical protein